MSHPNRNRDRQKALMKHIKDIHTIGIVGLGLIGSSVARACKSYGLNAEIVGLERNQATCDQVLELGLASKCEIDPSILKDADLVFLAVPMGAVKDVVANIMPYLKLGCILTDVSSAKGSVIEDVRSVLSDDVYFVPGHPIAGTENSGPASGFAELFEDRWCILTPDETTILNALETVRQIWEKFGAKVEIMDVKQHDQVLAMTSHLPHLIAWTIIGTAADLGDDMKSQVIEYSAGGLRDFTRLAASNPETWRDIFLGNKKAVLDVLQRFSEDLTSLQKAIRRDKGDVLFEYFAKTRDIHAATIKAGQDHSSDKSS